MSSGSLPSAHQSPDAAPGGTGNRPPVLLLVEDNPINARVSMLFLEKAGFAADHVTNGAQAVEKFAGTEYPAVLMDCHMPIMDGYEAARRIRELEASPGWTRPKSRIIAMTANVMSGERQRCLEAGMDDYVPKPIKQPELAAALAVLIPGTGSGAGEAAGAAGEPVDEGVRATLKQLAEELGEDNVVDLLAEWMGDFANAAADLDRLAGGTEQPELRRAAHSLKGSSSLFGLSVMEKLLHQLEQLAAESDTPGQAALVRQLEAEWLRMKPMLDRELEALKLQMGDTA